MAPKLDEQAVRHVAHLARLTVTDDEVARYARQLSDILTYVEKLEQLDTQNVEPTAHALPLSNVLRKDQPGNSITQDDALHNAPRQQDGFFRVPKVLDQETA